MVLRLTLAFVQNVHAPVKSAPTLHTRLVVSRGKRLLIDVLLRPFKDEVRACGVREPSKINRLIQLEEELLAQLMREILRWRVSCE